MSFLRGEQRTKFSTSESRGAQDGGHTAKVPGGLHVHTDGG